MMRQLKSSWRRSLSALCEKVFVHDSVSSTLRLGSLKIRKARFWDYSDEVRARMVRYKVSFKGQPLCALEIRK